MESLLSRQLMLFDLVRRPWESGSPVRDAPLHRLAVLPFQPARTRNLPSVRTYLLCFPEFSLSLKTGCWLCPWLAERTGHGDVDWHLKQDKERCERVNESKPKKKHFTQLRKEVNERSCEQIY